ncbi:hypothetical protein AB0L24_24145, partial [Streptomyces achromogenes]
DQRHHQGARHQPGQARHHQGAVQPGGERGPQGVLRDAVPQQRPGAAAGQRVRRVVGEPVPATPNSSAPPAAPSPRSGAGCPP